jgi:hypothetical protein
MQVNVISNIITPWKDALFLFVLQMVGLSPNPIVILVASKVMIASGFLLHPYDPSSGCSCNYIHLSTWHSKRENIGSKETHHWSYGQLHTLPIN